MNLLFGEFQPDSLKLGVRCDLLNKVIALVFYKESFLELRHSSQNKIFLTISKILEAECVSHFRYRSLIKQNFLMRNIQNFFVIQVLHFRGHFMQSRKHFKNLKLHSICQKLFSEFKLSSQRQTYHKPPFGEMKVVDIVKAGDYVLTGMMNPIESGIYHHSKYISQLSKYLQLSSSNFYNIYNFDLF